MVPLEVGTLGRFLFFPKIRRDIRQKVGSAVHDTPWNGNSAVYLTPGNIDSAVYLSPRNGDSAVYLTYTGEWRLGSVSYTVEFMPTTFCSILFFLTPFQPILTSATRRCILHQGIVTRGCILHRGIVSWRCILHRRMAIQRCKIHWGGHC